MEQIPNYSKEQLKEMLKKAEAEERQVQQKKQTDYESRKDEFLAKMLNRFIDASDLLSEMKEESLKTGLELNEIMYKVHDREPKDQKHISIISTDGLKKLEVAYQDKIILDDSAQVGIDMIHEMMEDKYAKNNKSMYRAMEILLSKNKKGDYDPKMVIKLKAMSDEINDERFVKGLEIISKGWRVSGTGTYVRMYFKNDKNNWENIPLQFSSM